MKLLIAGIQMGCNNNPEAECRFILSHYLPTILAKASIDSTVLLVWYEYALTPVAISHETKKRCIQILQEGLADYPNVVLIPGSFASIKPYASKPEKLQKIEHAYQYRLQNPEDRQDEAFMDEFRNFTVQKKRMQEENLVGHCLSNSAYAVTRYGQFKHKKVNVIQEYLKLLTPLEKDNFKDTGSLSYAGEHLFYRNKPTALKNWIVDPGLTKMTQKIQISDNDFIDMRLLICRDHDKDNTFQPPELPLLEVIVSNSIRVNRDALWGAVTIHMDYLSGLSVYVNDLHPDRARIESITALNFKYNFSPVPIQNVDRVLQKEEENSLEWD